MNKKILLVEDNLDDVTLIMCALKKIGMYWLLINELPPLKKG